MQPLGETKISDARLVELIDNNVGRFEVAVQDAAFVRIIDRFSNDLDVANRAAEPVAVAQFAIRVDPGETLALNKIHGEERLAVVRAYFVDGNDVRVLQTGSGRRFSAKTLRHVFSGLPAE